MSAVAETLPPLAEEGVSSECLGCYGPLETTEEQEDNLCQSCYDSGEFAYCRVCREWMRHENRCRHICVYIDGIYYGAGSDETEWEEYREPVFFALSLVPGMADAVARAIKAGTVHFYEWGSMLGPLELSCLCPPCRDWGLDLRRAYEAEAWVRTHGEYGYDYDRCIDILTDAEKERVRIGMAWLFGLFKDAWPELNAQTLSWLSEMDTWRSERFGCGEGI